MKARKLFSIAALIAASLEVCSGSLPAYGASKINVVVVDSGSDFEHRELRPLAKPNMAELKGLPRKDDDKNGYKDDIYGWNFVENNNVLVDLENTPPDGMYDQVLELMEALGRLQANGKGDFTPEEWNKYSKAYHDPKVEPWMNYFGEWAHGTHCAGIIGLDNENVSLNAIKHIDTGSVPMFAKQALEEIKLKIAGVTATKQAITMEIVETYFDLVGRNNARKIKKQADYIKSLNPRLVNCSFGVPNSNLNNMMRNNLKKWGFKNPGWEKVQQTVNTYVEKVLLPRDKVLLGSCPNALYFIAAGNSSDCVDSYKSSPIDTDIPNKIVVAATDRNLKLADFSCYGNDKVDVAAPGVNIYSTFPNQKMGYMSGTSMACPNALRTASYVLAANPDLTPIELKKILMNTVDKKSWLKYKVKSEGVINEKRAVAAAEAMKRGLSLEKACLEARKMVHDRITRQRPSKIDFRDSEVKKLYFRHVY